MNSGMNFDIILPKSIMINLSPEIVFPLNPLVAEIREGKPNPHLNNPRQSSSSRTDFDHGRAQNMVHGVVKYLDHEHLVV